MNYILYGELFPMIRKHLNKILKERLGEPDDFNVVKLDFEESPIDEIISEALQLPLGYDKKAVVVDNCAFLLKDGDDEAKKAILKMLEQSSDDINVIFILRSDKLDKANEVTKYIQEHGGQIFEFLNIEKDDWPIYIRKYFKSRNVEIEPSAVNELANRVDGDLSKFINEAEKLCLYKNSITLSDVLLMVSKPLEDDAFQMSNALFRGDNGLAISIYRDLKLLGPKFVDTLIPMLASQFRFVSEVAFLTKRGLDKEEIAKQLGVKPIRVQIAQKNSRNISRREIAHALDDLYNLDSQIKSGQVDRSYGLELFLINFPN